MTRPTIGKKVWHQAALTLTVAAVLVTASGTVPSMVTAADAAPSTAAAKTLPVITDSSPVEEIYGCEFTWSLTADAFNLNILPPKGKYRGCTHFVRAGARIRYDGALLNAYHWLYGRTIPLNKAGSSHASSEAWPHEWVVAGIDVTTSPVYAAKTVQVFVNLIKGGVQSP